MIRCQSKIHPTTPEVKPALGKDSQCVRLQTEFHIWLYQTPLEVGNLLIFPQLKALIF